MILEQLKGIVRDSSKRTVKAKPGVAFCFCQMTAVKKECKCAKMLYFNVILVINNDTLTNVSADFWLQSILQELQTQSIKSK